MSTIPNEFKESVFEEMFDILKQSNWSVKELTDYDDYLDIARSARDQKSAADRISKAAGRAEGLAEGLAEGKLEGKAEGLAEGKAEGLAEGILKSKIEIALKLLAAGMDVVSIAQTTDLSIEKIKELKNT